MHPEIWKRVAADLEEPAAVARIMAGGVGLVCAGLPIVGALLLKRGGER